MTRDVAFEPYDGDHERIDAAYRDKYADSSYLAPMVGPRARAATVETTPRAASGAR